MMKPFCVLLLLGCLELSVAQPSITNVQSLLDLLGVDNPRFPLLSPDGNTIFYKTERALCFFEIAADTSQCHEFPETFRGFGRYSAPIWSPDSSRVIFTESFFDVLRDSDIWQLDRASGEFTNLTDDGDARFDFMSDTPDPNLLIDYLPTFSPQGELYFFRSRLTSGINEILGEKFSLELFTFTETGEAKRVSSLRPQLPVLSVYIPAPISPDGERIALLVLGPQFYKDPTAGVWVQDLATGKREQILKLDHLPETRPGEPTDNPLVPRWLEWAGDEALIVTAEDYTGSFPMMMRNSFYIALETKEIIPFEDFSALGTTDLFKKGNVAQSPISRLPLAGFITSDAKHYIYVGGFNTEYFLWSRSLSLGDESAQLLTDLPKEPLLPGSLDTSATVSKDGKRALILGYLLTFE